MSAVFAVGKLRYYQPFMLLGSILVTVASGILTMLTTNQTVAIVVVGQVLVGIGTGAAPLALVAHQDALPREDIPIGIGILLTATYLGSALALAVAQTVFASLFQRDLAKILNSQDLTSIMDIGATNVRNLVPPSAELDDLLISTVMLLHGAGSCPSCLLVCQGWQFYSLSGTRWI